MINGRKPKILMLSTMNNFLNSVSNRMGVVLHGGLCDKLSTVHHGHTHGGGGGHGHSHAEDRNHSHSHSNGSSNHSHSAQNMNVRAALIHVIGDLVQSIGVLIAAIIIKYWVLFGLPIIISIALFLSILTINWLGSNETRVKVVFHSLWETSIKNSLIKYDY